MSEDKVKDKAEETAQRTFEESYYNLHTDLLRYSGFPALNGTQLDRLRIGINRIVTTLRTQIKAEVKALCTGLQKATIAGFMKVGEDMIKLEERIKALEEKPKDQ